MSLAQIFCENGRGEPVGAVVGELDGFGGAAEFADADYGAEDFFADDAHGGGDLECVGREERERKVRGGGGRGERGNLHWKIPSVR